MKNKNKLETSIQCDLWVLFQNETIRQVTGNTLNKLKHYVISYYN